MNDVTQTLIRSILKVGSGFLVSRGIATGDQVETMIAGLLALVGVVWGVIHRAHPTVSVSLSAPPQTSTQSQHAQEPPATNPS